ncbi:hypothetical protein IT418_01045 [bacterium]|nr:hypothetical protein [bacterium]
MDQSQDKFAQLSPVLELVYVMLTNMSKYMNVYATDIEADKTEQYKEASEALTNAIRKFDVLYGLKSPASADATTTTNELQVSPETLEPSVEATPTEAPVQPAYNFASGSDPESLKKAKQAVEELKSLFNTVKNENAEVSTQLPQQSEPAPTIQSGPIAQPVPVTVEAPVASSMPTFVSPESTPTPQPVVAEPAPVAAVPTPMNTQPENQDGGEIDSILSELKKLQNKGTGQL